MKSSRMFKVRREALFRGVSRARLHPQSPITIAPQGNIKGKWETVIRVIFGEALNTAEEYLSFPKNYPGAVLVRAQSGALFGLDARIALAIFSILSVVAGVAIVVNIDSTRAQVLATELADTGHAIESFHNDLKTDIFQSLTNPSGKNAFQALYDNSVIKENDDGVVLRGKWNGPYIKFTSSLNPRYGEMLLTKGGTDHTQSCSDDDLCYLYLVYSQAKPNVALEANKVLDGDAEKNPDKEGRLQWTPSADNGVTLYYRAVRALSPNMDF